jgi:hypothetical protein
MNTAMSESVIEGEADLSALLTRLEGDSPSSRWRRVLDDDHGIVDDEAGRDRQSHQREIIEAVAQLESTAKVPISDSGTAIPGMTVARKLRGKEI